MKALVTWMLALMLAGVCWGQTRAAPKTPDHTGEAHRRSDKPLPALSDADLEKVIRARFARSKIAPDKFEVKVQGGVATITGRTDVIQHKGTATRMARTAGARDVRNRVEISEAARQKAADNLERGRRRAVVKRGEKRSET